MASANINVRVDAELKKKAEELFDDLGLNMSTAIVMFLKCAVSRVGIPFEVRRVPNETTKEALAEYAKMLSDHDSYKRYDSFEELLEEVLEDA